MADTIERLVVEYDANLTKINDKLDKLNRSVHGSASKVKKEIEEVDHRWERMFLGEGPGKALDAVFSRTRLGVIEEGGAKIGVFGSAIEKLGPIGIATAAGIGAVTLAFEEAHKAAEFADEIEKTAKAAHVSTTALQEYRFAVMQADGSMQGADEALQSFSVSFGKAQEGLKKGLVPFRALGFTPEQIKSFHSTDEALRAVITRINELKTPSEKDAIISQLGLEGLKPLIMEGVGAMDALFAKARESGAVMDESLIHKGAEANRQFEALSQVISVQLKSAFIDLAPILSQLLTYVAEFARDIARAADALRSVENRSAATLHAEADSIRRGANDRSIVGNAIYAVEGLQQGRSPEEERRARLAHADALDWRAEQLSMSAGDPVAQAGTRSLIPPGGAGGSHRGSASSPVDRSDQEIQQAKAQELQAHIRLLQAVLDQLPIYADQETAMREIAAQQDAEAAAALAAKNAKVNNDRSISAAAKAQVIAANNAAAADEKRARDIETEQKIREQALAFSRSELQYREDILGDYDAVTEAEASIATTAAQRRDLEHRALLRAQQKERDEAVQSLNEQAVAEHWDPTALASRIAAKLGSLGDKNNAQDAAFDVQHLGPLEQYKRSLGDLDTQFQDMEANGIKSLSDGLADAIVNAKNLGDVAKNVFKEILSQILSMTIQKGILSFIPGLGSAIPAHASGTNYAPGGLSLVGEHGPELINLRRGSQVIPNDILRSMAMPRLVGSSSTVNYHVTIDLTGANGDETIRRIAYDAAAKGAAVATQTGAALAQQQAARRGRQTLY